jgi:hypothetical protein
VAIHIRFVVSQLDPDSGRRQGLFQAAASLEDRGVLAAHEIDDDRGVVNWFRKNLEKPDRFSISSRPHAKGQALSWFKAGSAAHIAKMRDLQRILEAHDVGVDVLRTERPGYIIYEDEHQVAAYPFADTPT